MLIRHEQLYCVFVYVYKYYTMHTVSKIMEIAGVNKTVAIEYMDHSSKGKTFAVSYDNTILMIRQTCSGIIEILNSNMPGIWVKSIVKQLESANCFDAAMNYL